MFINTDIILSMRFYMPTINLQKELYDECIRRGLDPAKFANAVVREKLKEEKG